MQNKKNVRILTVAEYAKEHIGNSGANHGKPCHRNNIYYLIKNNLLPKNVKSFEFAGRTLIEVKVKRTKNQKVKA